MRHEIPGIVMPGSVMRAFATWFVESMPDGTRRQFEKFAPLSLNCAARSGAIETRLLRPHFRQLRFERTNLRQ